MKWMYSLMIIACVLKIIITDDWEVRCWAFSCLLWVLIASGNQHSINDQKTSFMAKTRVKKTVITGVTSEQVEAALSEFSQADSRIQKITAEMELKITAIRDKHADELAELQKKKDDSMEILQVFATENKESLFSKTKSYKSAHGIFGFRTGTPKIKQLKGFTKESVLALVKAILPDYIRTAEEVAKDRLLADRDKEEVADNLSKCGMVVVQDETFYVEPKKEDQSS